MRIHPVLLNVTKDEDVQKTYRAVTNWLDEASTRRYRRLQALINNAGVIRAGNTDWISISNFDLCLQGT